MGNLIDGQKIAKQLNDATRKRAEVLREKGIVPGLGVVLVGNHAPSKTYVRKKGEMAEQIGLRFFLHEYPADTPSATLIEEVKKIQNNPALSGLIVQLPLPKDADTNALLNVLRSDIDIDCLTNENIGKLVMNTHRVAPPTARAVIRILEQLEMDFIGKNITILGAGPLVGKPLAIMLMNLRASVTVCNSATKDTKEKCRSADIIVTGVGKKHLLTADMVQPGAVVIDTGVSFEDGKMYGDVDVDAVKQVASWVTPTPGGVGPITIAELLSNTLTCAEALYANRE